MPTYLEKLRADCDMQCYFERPSAIAALSQASAEGFTISGCWRQQFDWAVLEWTRDNIFEHPAFRYLPDGDLSGLVLSYDEERQNCMAMDAAWYPTVDWPYLRIWAERDGMEALYKVPLKDHAVPVEGGFQEASATFELLGPVTAGDYVELAWLSEHFTYQLYGGDTVENAVLALANAINAAQGTMRAAAAGNRITLQWAAEAGANGNRIGVYGNVAGACTESWQPGWQTLSGGTSPSKWRVTLDFKSLRDQNGVAIPTEAVRKMRWTWAADIQPGGFARSDFEVKISNWTVTGTGRRYQVAGPGSLRFEDDSGRMAYAGQWSESRGNFSGGSIRHTTHAGASVSCEYYSPHPHRLYLGTRKAPACGAVRVTVDGAPITVNLALDEDVLVRVPLGEFAGATPHTVTITHAGTEGSYFYFDFLEAAVPTEQLPVFPEDDVATLATDWDTDHSIALAPERTAWMIRSLGFTGRANHYVGALWWYQLWQPGQEYASSTITFSGTPEFSKFTELWLGATPIAHLNLVGDTAESIALALAMEINAGSTALWARADGPVLTLRARAMGSSGNGMPITVVTNSQQFHAQVSGPMAGGVDGACRVGLESLPDAAWATDLEARPVINRAARDWQRSLFAALAGYGIEVAAAFSMELRHGDPSPALGIAQRYPDGAPVWLNTPALQTNFSPASTGFWKQAYLELATLMVEGGQRPFLQFGEVQWWYFAAPGSGMPFYDDSTKSAFQSAHGRPMHVFTSEWEDPSGYPEECALLAGSIGKFTDAVMAFVRQSYPEADFEVLYAPDVNEPPLTRLVNLPAEWSPERLRCFKSENFTYTGLRDLDKARESIRLPMELGFPRDRSSHLIGVAEYTTPWLRESELARGEGLESVVLFALDQFCFIGYGVPLKRAGGRSLYMGA